jgi:hypothetical protein
MKGIIMTDTFLEHMDNEIARVSDKLDKLKLARTAYVGEPIQDYPVEMIPPPRFSRPKRSKDQIKEILMGYFNDNPHEIVTKEQLLIALQQVYPWLELINIGSLLLHLVDTNKIEQVDEYYSLKIKQPRVPVLITRNYILNFLADYPGKMFQSKTINRQLKILHSDLHGNVVISQLSALKLENLITHINGRWGLVPEQIANMEETQEIDTVELGDI